MIKRSGLPGMDYEPSELERILLASAEADGPTPAETERAWREFRANAGALAALSSSPPTPSAPLASSPTPSAPLAWFAAPRARALQWLLLGAIGGGSLVALWRPLEQSAEPPPPLPVTLAVPASGELTPDPESGRAANLPAPPAAPRALPAGPPPRSPHPRRTAASPAPGRAAASESRLAREVAALDAARTALAIGANAEVLQQIEDYHREFPRGALAADADVVAIEALAAERNQVALARAVQRFLRQYPRDPHVARVRELESAAARTSGH
jgi:hypothetical protein